MTQLTMIRPAGLFTQTLLAPLVGMAVYLLSSAMTQSFDAADWQFAVIASGVLVLIAAGAAYVAVRGSNARTVTVVALVLAVLGLVSMPFLFWLGIPEIFGATAIGLGLEARVLRERWTPGTVTAVAVGIGSACLGAVVLWLW
jgi:hypothetical protein